MAVNKITNRHTVNKENIDRSSQVSTKNNIGLVLQGASSSKTVYVAGIIREAGTARAADAIDIRLGIVKD